jgi:molecular chaperone DnaK
MAAANKSLGRFHLAGIPPAPRGVPQIEVTFDIDANGIVNVSAKDLATGKSQSITITGSTRLSNDDIDQMVRDAEAHAAEDQRLREQAEVRNRAEQLIYQTEKTMQDLGDKVPSEDKLKVENALNDLREAVKSDDSQRISTATDALLQASYKLSELLYQKTSEQQQPAGGTDQQTEAQPQGGDDESVIDAEFKTE